VTRLRWVLVVLLLGAAPRASAEPTRDLTVFAAASLREVFEALRPAFERARPGSTVRFNFAGSQELRTQLEHGASADLLFSADLKQVEALAKAGLVLSSFVFARNEPVIVVPRGNPAGIHALADLAKTKRLVIGAPEVPIGGYTLKIFDAAGKKYGAALRARLEAAIVSRELNVKQVLAKVVLGEADAGVVYRSDALSARDKVEVVVVPPELNVVAEYPVAVLKSAVAGPDLAQAWLAVLFSEEGSRALTSRGFQPRPMTKIPVLGR